MPLELGWDVTKSLSVGVWGLNYREVTVRRQLMGKRGKVRGEVEAYYL